MTQAILIKTGNGYEGCTAFDGYATLIFPLKTRDERVIGNTTYASHEIRLAERDEPEVFKPRSELTGLYLLVHHGSGRRVYRLPTTKKKIILAALESLGEVEQYSMLYMLYRAASDALREGYNDAAQEWAQAYSDKAIKIKRATKTRGRRITIEYKFERVDLDTGERVDTDFTYQIKDGKFIRDDTGKPFRLGEMRMNQARDLRQSRVAANV